MLPNPFDQRTLSAHQTIPGYWIFPTGVKSQLQALDKLGSLMGNMELGGGQANHRSMCIEDEGP
jgi:hypothetical protein